MTVRKKTKFEEELDKILEDIAANNEDWNDPLQRGMYDFRQFQNGTAVREDDPLTRSIKEQPVDTKAYFKTEPSPYPGSKYGWPILAKEGEPAYNDPGLVLRNAAATAGDRRDRNIETAKREFAQAQDDFDRTFNPTDYGRRRSGRVMPLGGRAGMANLYRPQYNADMNQSINADENVVLDNKRLKSANSLEAEKNYSKGWLNGSEQHLTKLQKSIADYDKEIAKLQAEIAMSEAGDPMYDLAVMRMVMNDDMSLMNDIRGRIAKKIDQEFQMKQKKADQEFQYNERELNRENTLEVAKMNKEEQEKAKAIDNMREYEFQKEIYNALKDKYTKNKATMDPQSKADLESRIEQARIALKYKAKAAKMEDEFNEMNKVFIPETEAKQQDLMSNWLAKQGYKDNYTTWKKDVFDKASDEQKKKYIGSIESDDINLSFFPDLKAWKDSNANKAETDAKNTSAKNAFIAKMRKKSYGKKGYGKVSLTSDEKNKIAADKREAAKYGITLEFDDTTGYYKI